MKKGIQNAMNKAVSDLAALDAITSGIECSCKYYPKDFSSYEEYVRFLKEKGLAFEAPKGV